MSVSDGLVGNIALSTRLLLTDDDGLLPSTLLIYDGFLCFCDELWPSLIAIFFCSDFNTKGAFGTVAAFTFA